MGEVSVRMRGTSRVVFWLAASALGDLFVLLGGLDRNAAAFAAGVVISLAALWMLGGDRWLRWERTTHDTFGRVDIWPLLEAWDPDDWLSEPPWGSRDVA